jgi:hypothetical protein
MRLGLVEQEAFGFERFFDIVNGFLIDAVAHRDFGVRSNPCGWARMRNKQMLNLAEIIVRT